MKNIFDAVKGGNFNEISQGLNAALGGKLDTVMKNAGGLMGQQSSPAQKGYATSGQASSGQAPSGSSLGGVGGLLGATAVGGVLGVLFGGKKSAKKMAKKAVLVGGTAAAGALAWKFYQKWAEGKNNPVTPPAGGGYASPTGYGAGQFGDAPQQQPAQVTQQAQSASPESGLAIEDTTALILLEAMVFAARADGHIDAEEQAYIENAVESLFPDKEMATVLHDLLSKPIDPNSLASKVQNAEEAADLYRLSCAAITVDSFMERSYLDGLAKALGLDEAQKTTLEHEAAAVRESMEQ